MLPVCHQLFAAGWLGKGIFLPPQRLTPFTEQTLGRLAVCLAHLCEDALKAALLALLEVCRGKGILFPFPPGWDTATEKQVQCHHGAYGTCWPARRDPRSPLCTQGCREWAYTQHYCSLLLKNKTKKPKQKGKRLFGVSFWQAVVRLQAELRSSCMAACCSGLSCAMHSAHNPPEVCGVNTVRLSDSVRHM